MVCPWKEEEKTDQEGYFTRSGTEGIALEYSAASPGAHGLAFSELVEFSIL